MPGDAGSVRGASEAQLLLPRPEHLISGATETEPFSTPRLLERGGT